MKILFFIDTFSAGGKERRLVELMKGLKLHPVLNFELVIMSSDIYFREVLELGIKIHHIIRRTKKDVSVFKKVYRICKSYKPDVVHCWDSMSAIYLIPSVKLLNLPFINGIVTDAPEKQNILNKYWLRAKLTFPFSDVIIGNSQAGLRAYSAPASKSVCIYNGFNFRRISQVTQHEQVRSQLGIITPFVVGMVASFSTYKDYKTYFIAAQLLLKKRNDITFLAIGNDTNSDAAKELVGKDFADHFRLMGSITGVESLVNAIDICVLSTFTEGISNSILEYMALSKPVIATSGGGTNELVVDNETGFLTGQQDPDELAAKIELLINDAALRIRMGAAGKQRVQNCFSIDKMVNEYIVNYNKVSV